MAVTAYIALGSNLGDRAQNLERAIQALREYAGITVNRVSNIYETEPVGGPPGQNDFLNAALEIETELTAAQLLHALLAIEQQLGRVRAEKDGPRTIDLDLLLYGDELLNESGLVVPHPRMHERGFVLEPLAEIAPDVMHPTLRKTIEQLWEEFDPDEVDEDDDDLPVVRPAGPKSFSLAGQRALVTGSTSGIGRAIAVAFASAGASVILHGRDERAADAVADEIEARGVETGIILADLNNLDECRKLVAMAWEDWGPIDIFVNNAGTDTLTGEMAELSFAAKLQSLLDVDLMATIMMSRDVGKRMQKEGNGVILNMGWDQAETGMEGDSGQLFAAVKGAVMAFSKSLALTLAPDVRVNCLAPGWIRTAWGEEASDYWQRRVLSETPLERWGSPEDVAAAACWAVSPAASFITGQIIRVNGGAVR